MNLSQFGRNGPFISNQDGKLVFVATPGARFAYVLPSAAQADRLSAISRKWGVAEIAAILILASVTLRPMGPLATLAITVAVLLGSTLAYRFVVGRMLAGCERVARSGLSMADAITGVERTLGIAARATHPAFFWFSGVLSTGLLTASIVFLHDAHSRNQVLAGLIGAAVLISAALASAWMLAERRQTAAVGRRTTLTHRRASI